MQHSKKEKELYEAFKNELPDKLRESIDKKLNVPAYQPRENLPPDPLPTVSSIGLAKKTVSALESACNKTLPDYANPFLLLSDNWPAFRCMHSLYCSCILYLTTYTDNYDNSFSNIDYLLCIANRKGNIASIFDGLIGQIRYGHSPTNEYDSITNKPISAVSTLKNYLTGEMVKDYYRPDGKLANQDDLALNCYQKYYAQQADLLKAKTPIDIPSYCRLPFTYAGFTKRLIREAIIKNTVLKKEGVEAMKADEMTLKMNQLYSQYKNSLDNNLEGNLFERLRIEALFEFLKDPSADESQKEKYSSMLETYIEEFRQQNATANQFANADESLETLFNSSQFETK